MFRVLRPLWRRINLLLLLDEERSKHRYRRHGGGASSAAAAVPQVLFYSTCTGTVGADLTTNVPEIGSAWTSGALNYSIRQAGDQMARCDVADTAARFTGASAVLLSADVLRNTGATSIAGLIARQLDSSNRLIATIEAAVIAIYEEVAGIITLRASTAHAYTAGVEYPMTLTVTAANAVTAVADGATVNYSGALNSGQTTCGIYGDGLTPASRFDDVTATEVL